ncbi:hypothetical protein HYC85_026836 [Camellia sinensis]|uniref:F-box domain-containing protein n=1 Tax=Camellia sinensis TaxID=4442 RepID=A0A7J7G560_CAMSI|nr:hypothetical protein HYC85_026836 [Camellia sinensis]
MEGRKWEELNMDCLENVLGRVGIESLLLDILFVCKSWFKATLSSLCWRRLNFSQVLTARYMYKYEVKFCAISMMKFVVDRSERYATYLSLPNRSLTDEALIYVIDRCPNLRTFVLPYVLPYEHMLKILNLINKWKSLEYLTLGYKYNPPIDEYKAMLHPFAIKPKQPDLGRGVHHQGRDVHHLGRDVTLAPSDLVLEWYDLDRGVAHLGRGVAQFSPVSSFQADVFVPLDFRSLALSRYHCLPMCLAI